MYAINRLINVIGFFFLILAFLAINVLIGLFLLSLFIVPITWIWAKFTNQSYNSLIDRYGILYKINTFGQYCWIITISIFIFYLLLFVSFI